MHSRKKFLGTHLDITLFDEDLDEKILEYIFYEVEKFEQKYSRFLKGNFLDTLNTKKSSQMNGELFSMLQLSQRVSQMTDGAFDITIRPFLENIGYGIEKNTLPLNYGYQNIEFDENHITLHNGVSLDLGGVGKGYLIDFIYKTLCLYSNNFIINFGGDIKVRGTHVIDLEDPLDSSKSIGNIEITNMSIAGSGPYKRNTKKGHHLINPKLGKSQDDKIGIFLTHNLAIFSDVFATAIFVSPLKTSLEILQKVKGLEGMILGKDGKIYTSQNFSPNLYFLKK